MPGVPNLPSTSQGGKLATVRCGKQGPADPGKHIALQASLQACCREANTATVQYPRRDPLPLGPGLRRVPYHADLRRFGLLMGGLSLVAAGYCWRRGWPIVVTTWGMIAVGWLTASAAFPAVLGPLYAACMRCAVIVGSINTRILLTLLFFGVFTPIGFIRRCFGARDEHFVACDRDSYWKRKPTVDFPRTMKHTF